MCKFSECRPMFVKLRANLGLKLSRQRLTSAEPGPILVKLGRNFDRQSASETANVWDTSRPIWGKVGRNRPNLMGG